MSGVGTFLIMVVIIIVFALALWKFDRFKKLMLFLGVGFALSFIIMAIIRIWLPTISIWWIFVIEAVVVVVFIIKVRQEGQNG